MIVHLCVCVCMCVGGQSSAGRQLKFVSMSEKRLFSFSNLDPWVVLCRSVWAIKEPFLLLHQPPDRTVAVLQSHVGQMCSNRGWWRFWCATFHFPLGSIHTGWLKSPCKCAWMTVKTTQDRLKQIKNSTSDQKSKSFHPRHICGQRLQRHVRSYFYWQALSLGIIKTTAEAQSGADCPSGAQLDSLSLLVRRHDSLGINWHNFARIHISLLLSKKSLLQIVLQPCLHQPGQYCCYRICMNWSYGKKSH